MDETNKKRIEVVEMRVGDIKFGFGNPRKIKKKKKEELERSIEQYGDFGLFLIDENNNAIGGNQRATTMAAQDPDRIVLCKRLIGYSEADLNLGFASIRMQESVIKYNEEFRFSSTIGLVCWFNKAALKSRYDENVRFKADTDFQLSELLNNRIIIVPEYLRAKAQYDKNSGGNNTNKNSSTMNETIEYLKNKWGKYYEHNFKTNQSKVKVRR